MRLTEHFSLEEMTRSAKATELGISNDLPQKYRTNAIQVADVLELVRAYYKLPIYVTSCYRGPALNVAVGGSPTSAHCKAMAADFNIEVPHIQVCRDMHLIYPDFDQVIYEFGPTGWVHLGLSANPRRQHLTAVKRVVRGKTKTVYLPGFVEA